MTYNETILWRRFMQSKGVLNNFEYLYRSHRFDKRDLDQYLDETDAEDVILSAFDFTGAGNTIFGFKYWKDMDEKWQVKLRDFRQNGEIEPEDKVYCPHCKRTLPKSSFSYNSKGQLHKHCKECESGQWDKQKKEQEKEERERQKQEEETRKLQWEVAVKESWLQKTSKVCAHCGKRKLRSEFAPSDTTEDGLQSFCKACQSGLESASNHVDNMETKKEEKPASLERLTAPKLGEYDATLHYKSAQKSITFNATLSELLQKGQFTKCYLNSDRTHRQFLIFNRVEGANIVGVSSRASMLLGINSAEICRTLATRFNLTMGDNYYLHITRNLSRRDEIVTIEVLAVRSRDEYVTIAQRRDGKEPVEEPKPEPVNVAPSPSKVEEEEAPKRDIPLLDFGDGSTAPPTAESLINTLIERHLCTEQDFAAYLYKQGWKLQEPVRSYKKFTL